MRILLVLPRDNTYTYRGAFSRAISYAPLTLTTLAALVPKELEAHIDLVDEGVQPPCDDRDDYDIVGITACASSSPRAYELAAKMRARGAHVVLGGAHPTLLPEEAARHADSLVIGAADLSWPKLLHDFANGKTDKRYCEALRPTFSCPPARRDLLPRGAYIKAPTVLATMGCGNRCSFCSINRLWGSHLRRDIDEVIDEIRGLSTRQILFLDPNLTYDKDYAKELLRRLVPLGLKWAGLAGTDIDSDKELLELVIRSGCIGLLMGFESFSKASLDCSDKSTNDVRSYKSTVSTLHGHGIAVLGTFVLGLDADTLESIAAMAEAIDEVGIDLPRFSVLTPFPGTPLFERMDAEERILTKDWYFYDQEHVVFEPAHMSPVQLQRALTDMWRRIYSVRRVAARTLAAKQGKLLLAAANLGFRRYQRRLAITGKRHEHQILAGLERPGQ